MKLQRPNEGRLESSRHALQQHTGELPSQAEVTGVYSYREMMMMMMKKMMKGGGGEGSRRDSLASLRVVRCMQAQ